MMMTEAFVQLYESKESVYLLYIGFVLLVRLATIITYIHAFIEYLLTNFKFCFPCLLYVNLQHLQIYFIF